MTAERLLAHYEKIADAPDAIARLRRFILDLAIRGKLVQQDPNDEPASEFLKRIAKEKARLVKAGEIKADRSEKSRRGESEPFALPAGWVWASLKDLCLSITDGDHLPPPKAVEGVPFLVISDVRSKVINYDSERRVPRSYYDALDPIRRPRVGDLLYTLVGSFGIPVPVVSAIEFCVQRHIGILRPSSEVGVSFLTRFMESGFVFEQADRCATGIAQRTIPLAGLRVFKVPLPPPAEQHRIVAKVDELMGLCDRLEAARQTREATRDRLAASSLARLNAPEPETFRNDARFALDALPALTTRPEQIRALRQAILNLAVRGKLVPQDAKDEPASELHRQLAAMFSGKFRGAGRGKRSEVAAGLIDQPPYDLPPRWTWVRMGDLGDTNIGLTYSPGDVGQRGVPVLRSNNIQDGRLDLTGLVRVTFSPKATVMAQHGDMLICARNGSRSLVGKAAIIDQLSEPMAFGAFMAIFRSPLNPYLHLFLTSPVFRQVIDEVNTTTINQITQANLRSTLVPLPPLTEQHRIVSKVDALMVLCDRLEVSLTTTATTRRRLLDALLAEALAPADARELEAAE